jgi:two-component system OmpR family response regulator
LRVLLVEDDKKMASFIIKGLKQEGFAVDHATNGEDGLHLVLHEPYDAAIVDIMLPKLDGLSPINEMGRDKINTPGLEGSALGAAFKAAYLAGESPAPGIAYIPG